MRTLQKLAVALSLALAFHLEAKAGLIVNYNLDGLGGAETFVAPTNVGPVGITGLNLTRGSGLGATGAQDSFNSNDFTGESTDYLSFGFSVNGGSVDLNHLVIGTRSSPTGPGSLGLFYSGDGFATNLFTFSQSADVFVNSNIDLSGLTGLTGNVEFRITAIGTTSANGGSTGSSGTFRLTNFNQSAATLMSFDGTFNSTAVPEPSSMAVLGLVSVLGVGTRLLRMRRKSNNCA